MDETPLTDEQIAEGGIFEIRADKLDNRWSIISIRLPRTRGAMKEEEEGASDSPEWRLMRFFLTGARDTVDMLQRSLPVKFTNEVDLPILSAHLAAVLELVQLASDARKRQIEKQH